MIFSGFFDNCYTKYCKFRIKIFIFLSCTQAEALLFVSIKSISGAWPYGQPSLLRDLALLTNYPSHSTRPLASSHWVSFTFDHTAVSAGFPSKVNIELSKRLKFTVRGFETVSKGFSFLLEKFGCGCTQRSRQQWNKGEQIFDLFCL